jgi:hypothetical protein
LSFLLLKLQDRRVESADRRIPAIGAIGQGAMDKRSLKDALRLVLHAHGARPQMPG